MEKISIPVIPILSYIIGEFFKLVVLRKKKRYKYIPLIVGIAGGMIGLSMVYISPELILTKNPYTATAIGIVSGLASTGTNELIKQIKGEKKNGRDL